MSNKYIPFISVIVPNYNHSKYLRQRLDCILSQTYKRLELIILDDCSTDDSVSVIKTYKDERITNVVVNEINVGKPFLQWKKGIDLAKGDWIWIAESDDFCEPTLLEELVGSIRDEDTVLAYSTSVWVNSDGNPTWTPNRTRNKCISGRNYLNKYLLFACYLYNASSAIFRKDAALKVSDDFIRMSSAGDYMFWAEIASQGNVAIVNKGLNYFRRHAGASSASKFCSGENLINEKVVFDYITAQSRPSIFRIYWAKSYRILQVNRNKYLSSETRNKIVQLWGGYKENFFLKFLFWIHFHLRVRYNIYL